MDDFKQALTAAGFAGEFLDDATSKDFYSHDASLFEIRPQLIVCPKDSDDVQRLVAVATTFKKKLPSLSLTARSAGTDMSGGAVNDSIIVDFNKHFNKIIDVNAAEAHAQPGVFYRDFEKATLEYKALMPSYPASRDLCTIGGMVANNSGGEKSLEYGKTIDFVNELRVVFADGKEYTVRPLTKAQLVKKMAQGNYEGNIYKGIFNLIEKNYDEIKAAKPRVSKNSMGYNIWDVWDRKTGIFDLSKLIIGSQGTLGFVTDIKFRLVPKRDYTGLLVCFMKDIAPLGDVINKVLTHKPATFESFDDQTLYLSIRFLPSFRKYLGTWGLIKLMFSLIPDGLMLLRGIPKLILMVEFNGNSQAEVEQKIDALRADLRPYGMAMERDETAAKSQKFWIMRRQSFNLLRSKVKDKHTAPFIDDLVVNPPHLPEFLPRLRAIIKKYKLNATIAGHMGDGNFHIIPLMKIEDPAEKNKILPAMEEVDDLVLHYGGSLSGEHNDGLVRGPWLKEQFGEHIVAIFRQAKYICDPQNIFNPHKKADADWDYSYKHIRDHF
ncbi:MAG TPA: FAD-binding oxidoreductase [Candidatus Saccharimonadales bacterium]